MSSLSTNNDKFTSLQGGEIAAAGRGGGGGGGGAWGASTRTMDASRSFHHASSVVQWEKSVRSERRTENTELPLMRGGEMEEKFVLKLSRKQPFAAARRRAEKMIDRFGMVDIRALGAALPLAVTLAAEMAGASAGKLQVHTRTYSAPKGLKESENSRTRSMKNGKIPSANIERNCHQSHGASMPNSDNIQYVSGISILVFAKKYP